jgi:hypothetical protein
MTDFFDRQEWLARGRELVAAHNGSHWRLGDWCNENPYRNPDSKDDRCEYSKLADEVGIARTTLWTVAWVARHVPTSIRIDALSFTHHRLIAALPETDQRYWLARADKECLSVGALRKALKTPAAPADPEQSAETPAPTDPVKERREELERQVRWLADQRGWNPDVVMSDALAAYLAQPAVADEIKRLRQAEFTRKWESNGLRQWWRQVGDRIDALVGEMCERRDDDFRTDSASFTTPAASDVVAAYESTYGQRFPFYFARKRTLFGDHYGDLSPEDCHCGEFGEPVEWEQSLAAQLLKAEQYEPSETELAAVDAAQDATAQDTQCPFEQLEEEAF